MASEVVAEGAVVDLVRVVAQERALLCEAILTVDGVSTPLGFRLVPEGVTAAQVLAELHARMRGIAERLRSPSVDTGWQAQQRLEEMVVDLEVTLTGLRL